MDIVQFTRSFFFPCNFIVFFLEACSLCVYIKDRYVPSNSQKLRSVDDWLITFAASPRSVQLLQ